MIFLRIIPDGGSDIDIATRKYLRIASEMPPASDMTVEAAIEQSYRNECYIFAAFDKEVIGAMALKAYYTEEGLVLNVVLLGGENIMQWKNAAKVKVVEVMKQIGASSLYIVGRYGWLKIFPELELIGAIYKLSLANDSPV